MDAYTLQGLTGGVLSAAQGRKNLGWRREKIILNAFTDDLKEHDVHNGHLLTETEARDVAQSMGLSDINSVKAEMYDLFTEVNRHPPNIVTENPDEIIARREEGKKEAKWRGWNA